MNMTSWSLPHMDDLCCMFLHLDVHGPHLLKLGQPTKPSLDVHYHWLVGSRAPVFIKPSIESLRWFLSQRTSPSFPCIYMLRIKQIPLEQHKCARPQSALRAPGSATIKFPHACLWLLGLCSYFCMLASCGCPWVGWCHAQIPDADAIIQTSDFPCFLRSPTHPKPNEVPPPPIFGYNSDVNHSDIPFPDYTYWGHEYQHLTGGHKQLSS